MAKAPINVTISGDYNDRDIKRAIKDLQSLQKDGGKTSQSLGTSFKDIAAKAALVGGAIAGVGAVINSFVQSASNLAESQSKVGVVFAENADEVMAWAKQSAVAFGQTEQQALEAAGTYGNLFQAFGLTRDAATEMSTTMVELAADLASFNNTSIDDAIEALRSGLSGETEPLKRLGVALNDSRMKAEAMALGIYEGTGALNAAQKAQAAYAVIMKDTTLAQGDFARTSDGLANQQRILEAQFGNLTAQIGTALLPAALAVVGALNSFIGVIARVTTFVQDNSKAFAVATAAVIALTASMLANRIGGIALAAQYAAGIIQVGLYTAGVTIARIATIALTAAMRAIPFIAVIAGATALVMALSDLETESSKARKAANDHAKSLREQNEQLGYVNNTGRTWLATSKAVTSAQRGTRDAVSATVSAAVEYGNTLPKVIDMTEDLGTATRTVAGDILSMMTAAVEAGRMWRQMRATSGTVTSAIYEGLSAGADLTAERLAEIRESLEKTEGAARKAGGGAASLNKELDKLSDKKQARLDGLKELAKTAMESFKEMRDGVYQTMSGWLSIGDAAEAYAARQKAVTDTLAALEEGRRKMTKDSTDEQKAELQELADAHERAKAAAKSGAQSIVEEFVEQSKRFGEFGEKMRKLLAAGLNKTTFKQILEMGADRGSDVADSYLNGNTAELVRQTNETVAEYDKLSQAIANESAKAFYQAGLQSAIALLKAFSATLGKNGAARKELRALIKDLESELTINISTNVATPTGGTQSFAPASTGAGDLYTAPDLAAVAQAFPQFTPSTSGGGNTIQIGGVFFTPFADGGLVKGPTLGLVGEAGPELIVPLDRLGSMGGETNINLTVNAGMGTNGAEVGRQIVDALKQYNRRNGPIPVSVNG